MAEIRVEDKRNNNNRSIWPWILGALLLIGLIWGVSALTSDDDDRVREANRIETTTPNDGEMRPVDREPVRNDEFNNDRTLENDEMRNDQMMEDNRMRNDELLEDDDMRNDRVRDEAVID
ncbi:hypothetical protein [Cesiribacter andamanensis]|uniref:Uncharacterized protein n=1 Tax=Cesiribacter andamanensis AMV16 TaxID=1279009 RepID=M7N3U7_9BACT|nr:hypothetical protein [Cesiribacter andamanensis]EMR01886.1 hypothetical protein ADICEAN_02988 [Cesiribacter andamanensis AMV16]